MGGGYRKLFYSCMKQIVLTEELVHTLGVGGLQPKLEHSEKQCPKYPELVFLLNCLREIIGNI